MRRLTLAVLVGLAGCTLTACGTPHPSTRANPTATVRPSPSPSCPEAGGTRITFGADHAHGPLYGSGTSGVVLVNQSDRDWCGWFPLPSAIGDERHPTRRYLGFDTARDGTVADVAHAVAELRRRGVTHVVLVGASAGARDALVAATRITPRVDAVVALSPERRAYVLAAAPKLRVPVLVASAATDTWVPAADARAIAAAVPAAYRHEVVVPGSRHGIDLATYDAPAAGRTAITAFLTRYAPAR